MKPFVSILIPCYNAERWITHAIDSALDQTWPDKEVIVIDDGSTDGSLEIIKQFGDRIRWETGPNRGGNAARNRLLKLARGDWIQYLDADDYLLPDKVLKQVEFVEKYADTEILFSPFTLVHRSRNLVRIEDTSVPEPHDPWILLARWFLPGTGSGVWLKQALMDIGGWNEQQPCCQEHELYLRLLMAGKRFKYCSDGGYMYRQWSETTVCRRDKRETHRRRLDIERRAEEHLRTRNELTPERLQAINQGRFETARTVWRYDRTFASEIMQQVRHSQPGFVPAGKAAPSRYRRVFRLFGFRAAERVADLNREWSQHSSGSGGFEYVSGKTASSFVKPGSARVRQNELISILIPCYNTGQWITQAIESALAQTWPAKEIIVVDDGSTDGSLDVIKSFGKRVAWETGPNRGGNVARNHLLELAKGDWLQYLDADDYLLPDKITRQMETLVKCSQADVVFAPVTLEYCFRGEVRQEPLPIPEPHDPWILLAGWHLPQTGGPIWRKQALLDVGGWKPDQPCCQEHEMYLRLLIAGKTFAYSPHNGAVYRHWSEQTVCKRDKPETHRRRLEVERRIEAFLREQKELTPGRLRAINQARFETARMAWLYDRATARQIMREVRSVHPDFIPNGNAAPMPYRVIYRMLGFRAAEHLAQLKRNRFGGSLESAKSDAR